ncbi:MAG: sigma-70 family RNA polymerase sigma factor [Planctomycetota bacterium]|nr:sigma-70 family RNA polymerase sigma factor [Planctomycetota bacterium]
MIAGREAALRCWRETRRPEALGALLKAQRDRAYSVALRFTGSPADAEDIVQDAFLKLLSRTHGFESGEAFELAVYRAVVQCALDASKGRRRRRQHEDVAARSGGVAHDESQTTQAERAELRALLREAVTELDEDERAPVVLCYHQGLSVVQAAQVLELPRETVRARLHRALGHLKAWLGAREKRVGLALLPALLWQDGQVRAPEALCRALDAALPGPECANVPAQPQPGPAGVLPAATAGWTHFAALSSAAVLALALGLMSFAGKRGGSEGLPRDSSAEAARAATAPNLNVAPAPAMTPEPRNPKEDVPMKKTLSALVLAGALAAPLSAQAADPSPDVAAVIKKIAERREAKAAATAKAAQAYQKGEGYRVQEGVRTIVRPGGAGGTNPEVVKVQVGEGKE